MNILASYLRRQTIKTTLVVLMLLFLLMVGTLFTSTLRAIARGVLPPDLLFIELSLRSVDVLSVLIPLSFYLDEKNQILIFFHLYYFLFVEHDYLK